MCEQALKSRNKHSYFFGVPEEEVHIVALLVTIERGKHGAVVSVAETER